MLGAASSILLAGVLMPVGDSIELKVYTQANEQIGINVLHYRVVTDENNSGLTQARVDEWSGFLSAVYRPLLAPAAQYKGCSAQLITLPVSPAPLFSANLAGAGTAVGLLLPRQTCGIITKRTAFAGRAFRGRVYVPFPGAADSEAGGIPTAGYLARLNALASTLFVPTSLGAPGSQFDSTLFLRHSDPTIPWTACTTAVVRNKWGTQRRRGSYGAANVSPV